MSARSAALAADVDRALDGSRPIEVVPLRPPRWRSPIRDRDGLAVKLCRCGQALRRKQQGNEADARALNYPPAYVRSYRQSIEHLLRRGLGVKTRHSSFSSSDRPFIMASWPNLPRTPVHRAFGGGAALAGAVDQVGRVGILGVGQRARRRRRAGGIACRRFRVPAARARRRRFFRRAASGSPANAPACRMRKSAVFSFSVTVAPQSAFSLSRAETSSACRPEQFSSDRN